MRYFLRPTPPLLDIDDYRDWKLLNAKVPPVDKDLIFEIFEDHYTKMFEDPRPTTEREYPGRPGLLIEVEESGKWYRIAFHLDEERWTAKLLTVVVTEKPRFHRLGAVIQYLYDRWLK